MTCLRCNQPIVNDELFVSVYRAHPRFNPGRGAGHAHLTCPQPEQPAPEPLSREEQEFRYGAAHCPDCRSLFHHATSCPRFTP